MICICDILRKSFFFVKQVAGLDVISPRRVLPFSVDLLRYLQYFQPLQLVLPVVNNYSCLLVGVPSTVRRGVCIFDDLFVHPEGFLPFVCVLIGGCYLLQDFD